MIDNSDVQPNLDNTNDQEIFECEKNQLLNDRNTYPPTSASVEKTLNTDIRPTGIPELDQVLYGGMPSNATVILAGGPGTGKTTLALQWLVAGYKQYNEPGLYITATEPINKALSNLKKHEFGKEFVMNKDTIVFEDLRTIISNLNMKEENLVDENLDRIIDAISDLIQTSGAKRVVIDSITALTYGLQEKSQVRKFIHHMDALITLSGVNIILISEASGADRSVFGVEEFIADGIIRLTRARESNELVHYLEIIKMRTISYNSRPISYKITPHGIKLFPDTEQDLTYQSSSKRITTGIPGLDEMTGGGFIEGSAILVTGTSGAGKSILSLQFLQNRLLEKQNAVLVSFEESKEQIYRNAKSFGWDLESYEKNGQLTVLTGFPESKYPQEHILTIQELTEKTNAKFLIFDSISAVESTFSSEKARDMITHLNAYLKSKAITTIYTNATQTLLGSTQVTDSRLSTITDQIIMLRYVEVQSKLRHALLILKMRGSSHDKSVKEIVFDTSGLRITNDFSGMEGVLTGSAKQVSASTEEKVHSLYMEMLGPMGEKLFNQEKKGGLSATKIHLMIQDLADQGILAKEKKEEFFSKINSIFGIK
ncbi:hypothetical protein A3F37_02600 [Candidatus Saccharibacteria bacterium RIFCSPHIGHO2_12_FULL_41_12]|nr:MAG: hypothetical protein A3F37_02600 [Candidatus Saccharibacteria bacterium RIFCSPHIGHO2_12_FULL_41_12]